VLPVLFFLLGYRVLDQLLVEFAPGSTTRRRVRRGLMPLIFVLIALQQLNLLEAVLEGMQRPLLGTGTSSLTAFSIVSAVAVLFGVALFGRALFAVVGHRFLPRFGVDRALAEAVATVVRYLVVTVGFLWALEILGFDLTTLKIAFGALGVGIGFGLQNIVNNFTSGLILLFERSVKRGDVLTVEGTDGKVEQVGLRASIIRTREGDDLIMPNSLLVENVVTNYSFRDRHKRVDVAVGVSYRSDPRQVEQILLRVAKACDAVLNDPEPSVMFTDFGESSIDFQLRVWIEEAWDHPLVRSHLLFDVWYALAEAGVEIPFPQRDLHVRSGELRVRRVDEAPGGEA
jgi:small-conductance mechanosensitive channel